MPPTPTHSGLIRKKKSGNYTLVFAANIAGVEKIYRAPIYRGYQIQKYLFVYLQVKSLRSHSNF